MNLIEQLGGYELAKQVFDSVPKDGNSYTVTRDDTGASFHSGEIFKALLEYRRQHNIFEVGDKVVIESYRNTYVSCGRPSQYSIGDLMVIHNLDGNVISDDDYNFIDYRDVRHATDAEIKANRRLRVLESDDCSDIQNHISPNTIVLEI